jgi:hypothetical protein
MQRAQLFVLCDYSTQIIPIFPLTMKQEQEQ